MTQFSMMWWFSHLHILPKWNIIESGVLVMCMCVCVCGACNTYGRARSPAHATCLHLNDNTSISCGSVISHIYVVHAWLYVHFLIIPMAMIIIIILTEAKGYYYHQSVAFMSSTLLSIWKFSDRILAVCVCVCMCSAPKLGMQSEENGSECIKAVVDQRRCTLELSANSEMNCYRNVSELAASCTRKKKRDKQTVCERMKTNEKTRNTKTEKDKTG